MQLEQEAKHFKQEYAHRLEIDKKEWGIEQIICRAPHACKIMTLYPDQQVSLHWHAEKTETFILIEGHLIVELVHKIGNRSIIHLTEPYSSITIKKNTPHTFYCPDKQEGNTVFIEASTTDKPDDSYRIYPSGPKGSGLNNW
jgi:mannose-6-phosphate isomerase-like protein (cupin superfamily)